MLIAHQPFRLNCDMILHDTIDIQKHEDANRCSSYIELVVPNYNFNEFRQHFRLAHAIFETILCYMIIFGPVPVHVSI